jgi:hypothetical protein
LFVIQNAVVTGSAFGGRGAEGLLSRKTKINVAFPATIEDVVDDNRRLDE